MPKQIQIPKYGSAEQNSVASNQHTVIKFPKQNARQLAELDPVAYNFDCAMQQTTGEQFLTLCFIGLINFVHILHRTNTAEVAVAASPLE